jgi:tellurite resistance protein
VGVAAEGVKSAVTGKEFDLDKALGRIPEFSTRIIEKNTEEDGSGLNYYSIEIKGVLPIGRSIDGVFVTSLFDITDDRNEPKVVLSVIDKFQEPATTAYSIANATGQLEPGYGFTRWVEIGRVFPLFVQTPYAGKRILNVVTRLTDVNGIEHLELGFLPSDLCYAVEINEIEIDQLAKGYKEAAKDKQECMRISVMLGMVVAMSDGTLDDPEGEVLKKWMAKVITPYSDAKRKELKETLNSAMKEAFAQIQEQSLSKSDLIDAFNKIGDNASKFEAMELCYDVMAADGVADPEEIKVLHRIGDALDLDIAELEKLRDLKMMGLSSQVEDGGAASLLGIDPEWDDGQVKKHLRSEFSKWNARLNNLQPGPDKEHAQKMLDTIGEMRSKYD